MPEHPDGYPNRALSTYKLTKPLEIHGVHRIGFRCFDYDWDMAEPLVVYKTPEWLQSDLALAKMGVPIYSTAKRLFRIVCVDYLQALESDDGIEFCKARGL